MPVVNDKSFGFYRRLILIPLDAKFSKEDPDYDPDVAQKVMSDEAMSYLLNIAVRGLRRMLKKGFSVSDKVTKAIETYKIQSSNTLSWIHDTELDETYLLSKDTGELYYEFKTWCETEGIENIPRQQTFSTDIMKKYEFSLSAQKRHSVTSKRIRFFEKVT
jgi:putative DNA primase/helicase